MKRVLDEPESAALAASLGGRERVVASAMVVVEVARAVRRVVDTPSARRRVQRILNDLDLVETSRPLLASAGRVDPAELRALDALHLASALTFGGELDAFVTYDRRQANAARTAGLPVESPGLISPA